MPISIPKFFQRAFAQNGGKQDVPITGDTSGGRASYDVGFPPVTRIPIVAGGIPPFGTDFNGVLYDLSQAIQYVQSGVSFPFNQDFATAIGGYEVGAIVSDASDKTLLWVNGTANNTAFPSGWTSFKRSDPTETVRGLPLVATQAEVNAGTNDAKAVTPSKIASVFSLGQTRQDLTASRAYGVIYTNNTSRPIMVTARGLTTISTRNRLSISANGQEYSSSFDNQNNEGLAVSAIVFPGQQYIVYSVGVSLTNWIEYR